VSKTVHARLHTHTHTHTHTLIHTHAHIHTGTLFICTHTHAHTGTLCNTHTLTHTQEADSDGNFDGKLNFEEFCSLFKDLATRPELRRLFNLYSSKKEWLTVEDLQRFLGGRARCV